MTAAPHADTLATTLSIPKLDAGVDNLTAALAYAAAGWYVLPVRRGTKHPGSIVGDGWQHQSSRDPDQIAAWFAGTDHGIALHAGRSGAVLIDMDYPEKTPPDVLQAIEQSWAPFQSSRADADGRGHYVFAQPPGRTLGNSVGSFRGCGFEVRGNNGVIIVVPSVHEEAERGGRYEWELTGPVPVLPPRIADNLPEATEASESATVAQVTEFLKNHTDATAPAILHGWRKALQGHCETGSRHDGAVQVMAGAMKEARAGFFPAGQAVDLLRAMFITAATRPPTGGEKQRTERGAGAEFDSILAWAVGQANAADLDEVRARTAAKMPNRVELVDHIGDHRNGAPVVGAPTGIDEEAFWGAYTELQDCRTYARAVRVGPWAMLGSVLAIAAATIPPDVVLPGIVGDYASVNVYGTLNGESGKIKSAAISAAQAWLHTTPTPAPIKPGSGQGLAKCFAYVKQPRGGTPTQIGKRWTAVAVIPEIDTLTAAGSLSSSNLWAEFRSAWSDERVGHDYADADKAIILQPRRYRLCMIVGVQPLRAQPLLDDIDAGTPQRFCWFPVDDPGAPDIRPDPPGALNLERWPQHDLASYEDIDDFRAQNLRHPVDRATLTVLVIPDEATAAVDAVAREKLRNNPDVDPLDGHRLLCQLKVAAALMRLCNRTSITSLDWDLAGTVMAVSDRTREQVKAKLSAANAQRSRDAAHLSGGRKVVETRMVADDENENVERVAEVIANALSVAEDRTLPGNKVSKATASRDKRWVPKALERLEADGRIDVQKFEYHGRPGIKVTLLGDNEDRTP